MNSTPSRSALLSSLLGVLTIAALLTLFGYLSVWYRMLILYPHWAAFTFLAISVLRLLSIAAIWYWSRVGIIVYLLLAAGSFAVCAVVGIFYAGIPAITGAIALAVLIWPSWRHMPWVVLTRASIRPPSG